MTAAIFLRPHARNFPEGPSYLSPLPELKNMHVQVLPGLDAFVGCIFKNEPKRTLVGEVLPQKMRNRKVESFKNVAQTFLSVHLHVSIAQTRMSAPHWAVSHCFLRKSNSRTDTAPPCLGKTWHIFSEKVTRFV